VRDESARASPNARAPKTRPDAEDIAEVPVEDSPRKAVVSPAASMLRDEIVVSGQRLWAASRQILMAAYIARRPVGFDVGAQSTEDPGWHPAALRALSGPVRGARRSPGEALIRASRDRRGTGAKHPPQ
jgi:hypothetical protein